MIAIGSEYDNHGLPGIRDSAPVVVCTVQCMVNERNTRSKLP